MTNQQSLYLESEALGGEQVFVTRMEGEERLSGLFRFELELSSAKLLDLSKLLREPASLGLRYALDQRGPSDQPLFAQRRFHGIFSELHMESAGPTGVLYRAVLVPRLWGLTESYRSRVFLDRAAPEIVLEVLEEAGLGRGEDFALSPSVEDALTQDSGDASGRARYPQREFVVQYEETDYDFVSRWLEHEGVYFLFDEQDGREKVTFCDSLGSYTPIRQGSLAYHPERAGQAAGAESSLDYEPSVHSLTCSQSRLPKSVLLKDYNWRTPTSDLTCEAEVQGGVQGVQYEYNNHYKNLEQGNALAQVRAEELGCRGTVYRGDSDCRTLSPGKTFELEGHFASELDQAYVITAIRHEGTQEANLETRVVASSHYLNHFEAIPAEVLFRPESVTDWPAIKGVMHASVDAEDEKGDYAYLDEHGRYRVEIPFDQGLTDHDAGKASRLVRMAQPYAGPDEGFHFPLRKGTEVLLTFIDGDPDRPLITGAVPNPDTATPVDAGNSSQSKIKTASGNTIQLEDEEGNEGLVMHSASGGVYKWYKRPGATTTGSEPVGTSGGGGGMGRRVPRALQAELPGGGSGAAGKDQQQDGRLDDQDAKNQEQDDRLDDQDTKDGEQDDKLQELEDRLNDLMDSGTDAGSPLARFLAMQEFTTAAAASDAGLGQGHVAGKVNAVLGLVYTPPGGKALHEVTSEFGGSIGNYAVNVGPVVEASFGDAGSYAEGPKQHEIARFDTVVAEEYGTTKTETANYSGKISSKTTVGDVRDELYPHGWCQGTIDSNVGSAGKPFRKIYEKIHAQDKWEHVHVAGLSGILTAVATSEITTIGTIKFEFFLSPTVLSIAIVPLLQTELFLGNQLSISGALTTEIAWGITMGYSTAVLDITLAEEAAKISGNDYDIKSGKFVLDDTQAKLDEKVAKLNGNMAVLKEDRVALKTALTALKKEATVGDDSKTALKAAVRALKLDLGV